MSENKPKILVLDIETKPSLAYIWRAYKENISPAQLVNEGGLLCFGAQWFGSKEVEFYSEWEHGLEETIKHAHRLLSEADAVVTYNGDKFDLPKLTGEFIKLGLPPVPPVTSIDVIKTVRKFGFIINKLSFIAPLLKAGRKVENEGFPLWTKVMNGDVKAQERMKRYCIGDVKVLTSLYKKVKPYIKNHPHLGKTQGCACGSCGSTKLQSRGYRRTKNFRIQRIQCQNCGSWQDGKREKVN